MAYELHTLRRDWLLALEAAHYDADRLAALHAAYQREMRLERWREALYIEQCLIVGQERAATWAAVIAQHAAASKSELLALLNLSHAKLQRWTRAELLEALAFDAQSSIEGAHSRTERLWPARRAALEEGAARDKLAS